MKFKMIFIILSLMISVGKGAEFYHEGADSNTINAPTLANYNDLATIVTYKSSFAVNLTIDSITIKFLNGDSADFLKGKNCQPGQFYEYNYDGWIYGVSTRSLRYIKDSLFVLQDSSGKLVTFTVYPYDTLQFGIYQITNCPFCGRMPSFPKTTAYRYVFHYAGGADSLKVVVQGSTSVRSASGVLRQPMQQTSRDAVFSIDGRKLQNGTMRCSGLIAGKKYARYRLLMKSSLNGNR